MPDITEPAVSEQTGQTAIDSVVPDAQIAPEVGATVDNAAESEVVSEPVAPVVEEKPTTVPINLYENRIEEARRLQSERDRSESYTRRLLEAITPYVQLDDNGNVIGPRTQQAQTPQINMQELAARAAIGDTDAILQMNQIAKNEAKTEALNEFRAMQSQELEKTKITNEIKQEFPDLFGEGGAPNADNPIWTEANNIVGNERKGWYDMNNPYHVKSVLEIARARVILNAYPQLKNTIKKEVTMDMKKTGALATASATNAQTQTPEKSSLSEEQIEQLKKTGKGSPEDLARISNMVKQVKNRSFVIS